MLLSDNSVWTAKVASSVESEIWTPKHDLKMSHFKTKCCSCRHSNTNPYWLVIPRLLKWLFFWPCFIRVLKKCDDEFNDHMISESGVTTWCWHSRNGPGSYTPIGHFRVLLCLCFKASLSAKTILMKMTLICMKMKLHAEIIFIWKVSHLDSF